MIEWALIGLALFLGLPVLAVLILTFWFMGRNELNRPPTKEEWKAGKRRKIWY